MSDAVKIAGDDRPAGQVAMDAASLKGGSVVSSRLASAAVNAASATGFAS